VAGELDPLPGSQVGEHLAPGLADLLLDPGDLFVEVHPDSVGFPVLDEFLEFALQFGDRFLEVQRLFHWAPV
jgi:hypothetical protein